MSVHQEEYRAMLSMRTSYMLARQRARQKLTTAQRMEIGYRRMEGESPMALALEYKVTRGTIDNCPKLERP